MIDRFQEMFDVLARERIRTALTALSVAWGIFMLVVLLGLGRGLENKTNEMFADDAVNSIWIWGGRTTLAHEGYPVGRRLTFTLRDFDAVVGGVNGAEYATGRYRPNSDVVVWGDRSGNFELRAVHPDHQHLEKSVITRGRFINPLDLEDRRKVAVVGQEVVRVLFRGADPIGEWIEVAGAPFQVVGVFEDEGEIGEMEMIYLPITTAQAVYGGGDRVHQIMYTVGDAGVEESEQMVDRTRQILARRLNFSERDRQAVRIRNNVERFLQVQQVFTLIQGFVWLVGLGTVAAGIVGVSNIMMVSVKERTSEIGLRKALGATPWAIVAMVLQEALVLTGLSGYAGLVVGVGTLELIRRFVPENDYILNPDVDLSVGISATVLLVLAGAVAGLIPALRAATVNPITALRDA